jgi:hypothetical protein
VENLFGIFEKEHYKTLFENQFVYFVLARCSGLLLYLVQYDLRWGGI